MQVQVTKFGCAQLEIPKGFCVWLLYLRWLLVRVHLICEQQLMGEYGECSTKSVNSSPAEVQYAWLADGDFI